MRCVVSNTIIHAYYMGRGCSTFASEPMGCVRRRTWGL